MREIIIMPFSRKSFLELQKVYKEALDEMPEEFLTEHDKQWMSWTYEEYLRYEMLHPHKVLFG